MNSIRTISFVIPQKGRLDFLEATVRSIANQSLQNDAERHSLKLELVVVTQDNDPTDARAIMERLLEHNEGLSYQLLEAPNSLATISALRNQAACACTGNFLAFIDADIQLASNWADAMTRELLGDDSRKLISAMQVKGSSPTVIEEIQVRLNHLRINTNVNALSGHNLLLSSSTFEEVGGFPEHLKTCEDSVFTDAVGQIGKLYRSSESSYVHLGEDRSFTQVFEKEKWRSHYNLATMVGRTVQPIELISFFAPALVLLFWFFSAAAGLIGHWAISVLLLFFGTLPIVAYTLRYILLAGRSPGGVIVLRYYVVYFTARGFGMLMGVSKAFEARRRQSERNL